MIISVGLNDGAVKRVRIVRDQLKGIDEGCKQKVQGAFFIV